MLWNHDLIFSTGRAQYQYYRFTGSFFKHETVPGSLLHNLNTSSCVSMPVLYSVLLLSKKKNKKPTTKQNSQKPTVTIQLQISEQSLFFHEIEDRSSISICDCL